MASHSELRPDDSALPLLIASAALSKAESRLTVATGTVVADNADGTQTWIGSNGSDDTNGVIKWVGDLSAPGRPLGLSAACSMQCVVVSWDGTLENGVPSDFAYIEVFARREGSVDDVVSWGRLSSAGMLMSPRYDIGTVFDAYAIAYDDAHDSTGMLARNQSEQSDLITVAVEQDADMEQIDAAVEEMSKKAEEAGAKAEQVRKDMQSEVDDVRARVDGLSSAGDRLSGQITDIRGTVNGQQSKLDEFGQKLEGVVTQNGATVKSVTELKQTVSGLDARVSQNTETAEGAMSKATTVQQTADGIKTTLSKDYTSTKDADRKYSTKTELSTEAGRIRTELSETTKTANGAMDKSTALETTVNGISTKISEQATTLNATVKTANEAKSTADSNKQTISQVSQTASGALTKATTVEANLNSYKTTVSETYATNSKVDDLATGGSNLLEHVNPTDLKVSYWVNEGMSTFDVQKLTTYTGVEKVTYGWRFKCGNTTSPLTNRVYYDVNKFTHIKDQAYTFSAWVKVGSGTATIKAQIAGGVDIASIKATTTWTRITGTYVASAAGSLTLRCSGTTEWYMCAPYVASCPEWITNRSYVNQTAQSVALGVVKDYKGADGSGLATKSDISVSRTEITSEVSNTYATKDGVSEEISSKITQNNGSWELKFATKTEAKSAQDAANTANTAAADAQARVGNLEPCIRMTSDGVRVGKQANGTYQDTSALVGTDGTFDVLDSSSKRLLEVGSSGVKFPKSGDGHQLALGYVTDSATETDTLYIGDIVTGQQEGGPKNRLGFTGDEVSLEGGDININASDNQLSLYGHKGANLLVPDGGNVQVGGQSGTSNTTLTLRGSTVNMSGGLVNVNGRTLNAPVDAKQSQRWDNIQLDVKCVNRVVTVNILHPLGTNAIIGDQGNQCEIGYIKEGYRPSRMIGCHLASYNTTNLFLEINPATGKVACFRMWGNQDAWAYFSASLSYVI